MNTNQVKETLDKYVMHTYGRYDLCTRSWTWKYCV